MLLSISGCRTETGSRICLTELSNLIDVGNVEDVSRFHTDLQVIFGMLKCRQDAEKLREYVEQHREYFESVDLETYQALRELLHSEKIL